MLTCQSDLTYNFAPPTCGKNKVLFGFVAFLLTAYCFSVKSTAHCFSFITLFMLAFPQLR